MLTFDRAEFLTGEAAQRAAEEDGAVPAGEPVPNDYYVRDADTATVRLELAPRVTVTAVRCPSSCRDGVPGDLAGLAASFADARPRTLADPYRGALSQYWITVRDGRVVAIDEQYLP